MSKIVSNSNLSKLEYVPYTLAWSLHLQGMIFTPYTLIHEAVFPAKYNREVFALADGEKIGLDWFEESMPTDKDAKSDKRPLLVCVGGLGGGHQAPYMLATMYKAKEMGYQVVFLLARNAGGMPIQSDKMVHMLSWKDIKEPSDFLYGKYV